MKASDLLIGTLLLISLLLVMHGCTTGNEQRPVKFRAPIAADSLQLADLPPKIPFQEPMFYRDIQQQLASKELHESLSYHALLQIGRYREVKENYEQELEWGLDSADRSAIERLKDYHLTDAREFILDQSDQHRLLIITEAHTKPEHRVFSRCLLEGLYERGYRHLGLENILALPSDPGGRMVDSLMNERGYPTLTAMSGTYTSEPEYANLIREATDLGFKLFSYERNGSSESERDRQQAERIIHYMSGIPEREKVICHGGWYHAIEAAIPKSDEGNYWMAYEYKQLSGDDPLTVYQDALNEKIAPMQKSSPYYEALREQLNGTDRPSVLVNASGEPWRGPGDSLPVDIVTVQPPLTYDRGAPWDSWDCWSCATSNISFVPLEVIPSLSQDGDYVVEVRRAYESDLATPVFVREITDVRQAIQLTSCRGETVAKSVSGTIILSFVNTPIHHGKHRI